MSATRFFFASLQLVFITLKLCNIILWPWPIVLLPFIAQASAVAILAGYVGYRAVQIQKAAADE